MKLFSLLTFCVVWHYSSSKLKDKQFKMKTLLKVYNNEINTVANPELASGFEQPGPGG